MNIYTSDYLIECSIPMYLCVHVYLQYYVKYVQ